jgi:hypothetical protein
MSTVPLLVDATVAGLAAVVAVRHADDMSGLTAVVAQVSSSFEAQVIVGLLKSNGIEATASSDDAGGQEPQWQLTQGVRVLVAAEDESEARQLIEQASDDGS